MAIASKSAGKITTAPTSRDRAIFLTGFTLVELLVVIGIIALLISILLPSLAKARFQAQIVSCLSNEHQLSLAITNYSSVNRGHLPFDSTLPSTVTGVPALWPYDWTYLIFPFVGKNVKAFQCPLVTDRIPGIPPSVLYQDGFTYSGWKTYEVNGLDLNRGWNPPYRPPFGTDNDVFFPAGTPICGQTCQLGAIGPDTIMLCDQIRGSTFASASFLLSGSSWTGIRCAGIASHYLKSSNFAFFDGHAETVPARKIMTDHGYGWTTTYGVGGIVPAGSNDGLPGDLEVSYGNPATAPLLGGYWTPLAADH